MHLNKKSAPVLAVDDRLENLAVLEQILPDIHLITAQSGKAALNLVDQYDFVLVLLDVQMPEMSGYDVAQALRQQRHTAHLPIIFITAECHEDSFKFKGYELGAVDYLLKPLDKTILRSKVNVFITLHEKQKQLEKAQYNNKRFKQILKLNDEFPEIIGKSQPLIHVFSLINKVAKTEITVLIYGESGTGKELVARALHNKSSRNHGPFIPVNCAAIPETLIESELFGHEKGAYTGAEEKRLGRFELAKDGSIFFDEIGELDLKMQAKLLRVLQEREYERVGGSTSISVNCRVITATNKNLEEMVKMGTFRNDLLYRLNSFPINTPPLREREGDVELLAGYFLEKYCKDHGKELKPFSKTALLSLKHYEWKGNVRELQNVIMRAVILSDDKEITEEILHLKHAQLLSSENDHSETILTEEEIVKAYAKDVYRKCGYEKKKTAEILNITYRTLMNRLE